MKLPFICFIRCGVGLDVHINFWSLGYAVEVTHLPAEPQSGREDPRRSTKSHGEDFRVGVY